MTVDCAFFGCGLPFTPTRSDRRFCSRACYIKDYNSQEHVKAKKFLYYLSRREHFLSYKKEYRAKHLEHTNKIQSEWNKANPERRRATLHKYNTSDWAKRRINNWHRANGWFNQRQYYYAKRTSTTKSQRLTKAQWEEILLTHHYSCAYCGVSGKMTQDHIIPISRGGSHIRDNVVPACLRCNQLKSDKPVTEFLERLKRIV